MDKGCGAAMKKNFIVIFVMTLLVLILAVASPGVALGSDSAVVDGAMGIGVNTETNMIYVANWSDDNVSVIDGSSNSIIAFVTVGDKPVDVGVNPITNMVYVANNGDGTVSIINGKDNSVVSQPIVVGGMPSSVCVNPATNKIYVSCINSENPEKSAVSVINGTSNLVENTIYGPVCPTGIDFDSVTNTGYVTCQNDAKVLLLSGQAATITGSIIVGNKPTGVCVNQATKGIYVTNKDDDTVSVISGESNSVVKTVKVGDGPCDICVNPNKNIVYAANESDGSVSVIDGANNEVVDTISIEGSPLGIGVNPATGNVYVSNNSDDSVMVISGSTVTARSSAATETAVPTITSITPTNGVVGLEVTIDGAKFGDVQGTSYVCFNQMGVSEYLLWSDTRIKCKVPNITGNLTVKVNVSDNYSNEVAFTSRSAEASGWASCLNGGLNYLIFASDENAGKPGLLFMIDFSNIFFPRIISSFVFGPNIDPFQLGWTVDAPPGQNVAKITGKCTLSGAAMYVNNFTMVVEDLGTSWFMLNNRDKIHLTVYDGTSASVIFDIQAVVGIGEMMIAY